MKPRLRRGVYRGIYSALIDDSDFQALSAKARHVFLTIRVSPQAGAAGIFRAYNAVVAEQTGLSTEDVEAALHELETSPSTERPWILREGGILWIRNALAYDPNLRISDPKHRAAIERVLAALPRSAIVAKFCKHYGLVSPFARPAKAPARPSDDPGGTSALRYPSTDIRVPISEHEHESEKGVRPSSPNGHGRSHVVHIGDQPEEVDL
jgi:hypothetical protein